MTTTMNTHNPKIIVALDYPQASSALALAAQLDPQLCRLKVGKELFTSAGPRLVEQLVDRGYGVFLDLKFHDIPNTVAKACQAASRLGVWMLNVHATGGRAMMQAARSGVDQSGRNPLLIAVTILTSMDQTVLEEIGFSGSIEQTVLRLAGLAQESGLDGVVCSAQETPDLRKSLGPDFCLVTPGIRPAGASSDDQSRIATPAEALNQGSSYLVIGRPITQAENPLQALQNISQEIQNL